MGAYKVGVHQPGGNHLILGLGHWMIIWVAAQPVKVKQQAPQENLPTVASSRRVWQVATAAA